jgi:hypothetical protein
MPTKRRQNSRAGFLENYRAAPDPKMLNTRSMAPDDDCRRNRHGNGREALRWR